MNSTDNFNVFNLISNALLKSLPYKCENLKELKYIFVHPIDKIQTNKYDKLINDNNQNDSILQLTSNLYHSNYIDNKCLPFKFKLGNGFEFKPVLSNFSNPYKSEESFKFLPENTKILLYMRTRFPEAYTRLVGGYNIENTGFLSNVSNVNLASNYEDPLIIKYNNSNENFYELLKQIYDENYLNKDYVIYFELIKKYIKLFINDDIENFNFLFENKNMILGKIRLEKDNIQDWILSLILYYLYKHHTDRYKMSYILTNLLKPIKIMYPNLFKFIKFDTKLSFDNYNTKNNDIDFIDLRDRFNLSNTDDKNNENNPLLETNSPTWDLQELEIQNTPTVDMKSQSFDFQNSQDKNIEDNHIENNHIGNNPFKNNPFVETKSQQSYNYKNSEEIQKIYDDIFNTKDDQELNNDNLYSDISNKNIEIENNYETNNISEIEKEKFMNIFLDNFKKFTPTLIYKYNIKFKELLGELFTKHANLTVNCKNISISENKINFCYFNLNENEDKDIIDTYIKLNNLFLEIIYEDLTAKKNYQKPKYYDDLNKKQYNQNNSKVIKYNAYNYIVLKIIKLNLEVIQKSDISYINKENIENIIRKNNEYFDNESTKINYSSPEIIKENIIEYFKELNINIGGNYHNYFNENIPEHIREMIMNDKSDLYINPLIIDNINFFKMLPIIDFIYSHNFNINDIKNNKITNEKNNSELTTLNIYDLFWNGISYEEYENLPYTTKIILNSTCYLMALFDETYEENIKDIQNSVENNLNNLEFSNKTTFCLPLQEAISYGRDIKRICICSIPIDSNITLYGLYSEINNLLKLHSDPSSINSDSMYLEKRLLNIREHKIRNPYDMLRSKILNIGLNEIGTKKFINALSTSKNPLDVVFIYSYYYKDFSLKENENYIIFPHTEIQQYANIVSLLLRSLNFDVSEEIDNLRKYRKLIVKPMFDVYSLKKKIFDIKSDFNDKQKNKIVNFINYISRFINQFLYTRMLENKVGGNKEKDSSIYIFDIIKKPSNLLNGVNINSFYKNYDIDEYMDVDIFSHENEYFKDKIHDLYENKNLSPETIMKILPENVIKRFEYCNSDRFIKGGVCMDKNPFDELQEALLIVKEKIEEENQENNCINLAKELLIQEKYEITKEDIIKLHNDVSKLIYNDKIAQRDAITCLVSDVVTNFGILNKKGLKLDDEILQDLNNKLREKFKIDTELHNLCLLLQIAKDITSILYAKKYITNGCVYKLNLEHLNMFFNLVKVKLNERRNIDKLTINKFLKDISTILNNDINNVDPNTLDITELTNEQFS